MKAQIIQIGNSQGLRIPKTLLEETGITGEVDLERHADGILIRNLKKPRGDWEERFAALGDLEDDSPVHPRTETEFAKKEWQW